MSVIKPTARLILYFLPVSAGTRGGSLIERSSHGDGASRGDYNARDEPTVRFGRSDASTDHARERVPTPRSHAAKTDLGAVIAEAAVGGESGLGEDCAKVRMGDGSKQGG